MDSIRVTAKTVSEAVMEASIQLGTSSDNIEYTVIDEGAKGFLGIGSRKAVIEAKKKFTDEDLMKEVFGNDEAKKEKPKKENARPAKKEAAPTEKKEKAPVQEKKQEQAKTEKAEQSVEAEPKKEVRKEGRRNEKRERRPEGRRENRQDAASAEETVKAQETSEPMKNASAEAASEQTPEPKKPRVPADPMEAKRRAEAFLSDMFRVMGMEITIRTEFENDTLLVDLSGEEMGLLIGKRGQTLDSLQYLTSLVVNKGKASYVRVKLDTEDYRNRRKATLENLAKNIAFKVKKTRRPVFLEPMNPYERRIIHSALQNDPYVTTHSEGEEPNRKVVITPKKRSERPEFERSERGGRGSYRRHGRPETGNAAETETAEVQETVETTVAAEETTQE